MKKFLNQIINQPSTRGLRRSIMFYGTFTVVVLWVMLHVLKPTSPKIEAMLDTPSPTPPSKNSQAARLPSHSHPLPKNTPSPTPQPAPSRPANKPSDATQGPTPEQKQHYEKTQTFVAEARQSLPLLSIRAYNPLEARKPSNDGSTTTPPEGDSQAGASSAMRDNRGLKDGEVWIRIDPASATKHQEIMAQTATLYRAKTGFEGEVKVILWVGSRPWSSKTF